MIMPKILSSGEDLPSHLSVHGKVTLSRAPPSFSFRFILLSPVSKARDSEYFRLLLQSSFGLSPLHSPQVCIIPYYFLPVCRVTQLSYMPARVSNRVAGTNASLHHINHSHSKSKNILPLRPYRCPFSYPIHSFRRCSAIPALVHSTIPASCLLSLASRAWTQ